MASDTTWEGCTYRCFAHSRPRPVFAPVTTTTFPSRFMSGTLVLPKAWPLSILITSLREAMAEMIGPDVDLFRNGSSKTDKPSAILNHVLTEKVTFHILLVDVPKTRKSLAFR
jgi:hypothetical protein